MSDLNSLCINLSLFHGNLSFLEAMDDTIPMDTKKATQLYVDSSSLRDLAVFAGTLVYRNHP